MQRRTFEESIAVEVVIAKLNFEQVITSPSVRGHFKTTFPTKNFQLPQNAIFQQLVIL
jgi:hypothetical protein